MNNLSIKEKVAAFAEATRLKKLEAENKELDALVVEMEVEAKGKLEDSFEKAQEVLFTAKRQDSSNLPITPITPVSETPELTPLQKLRAAMAASKEEKKIEVAESEVTPTELPKEPIKAEITKELPKVAPSKVVGSSTSDALARLRAKMAGTKIASSKPEVVKVEVPTPDVSEKVTLNVGTPSALLAAMEESELPASTSQIDSSQVTFDHLNERQKLAVALGTSGNSFVLIGSAGSGKTTTQRMILQELSRSSALGKLEGDVNSKHLVTGMPSVLITSFTKVATRNIKAAAPHEFKSSCINIHKAVEFSPTAVSKEVLDPETMELVTVERQMFVPQKNRFDPLLGITHVIIEEAGSLDTELFLKLVDALPSNVVYILLGDLNQIPPIYGAAILGFAIDKLPVVELTEVYRQNIGAIKELATEVLIGKPILPKRMEEIAATSKDGASLKLVPMTTKKKVKAEEGIRLNKGIGDYLRREVMNGKFQEGSSVFLTTVRKDTHEYLNINEMNRYVSQAFSELHKRTTYEIRSKSINGGRFYFAVGDLVFFEREYYKIATIDENKSYINTFGYDFKNPSVTLNRWGVDKFEQDHLLEALTAEDAMIDGQVADFMDMDIKDMEDDKNMISHTITLTPFIDEEDEAELQTSYSITVKSPGDLSKLQLGYAQTAHSAQGSEWKNVYLGFPDNVAFMLNREILYTSITRAREDLTIFYEDGKRPHNFMKGTFEVGVKRQAIEGDNLIDKVKFFRNLGKDAVYRNITKLLDNLNKSGRIHIEDLYELNNDGSHTPM